MNRNLIFGNASGSVEYDDTQPQWHAVKEGAVCVFDKNTKPVKSDQNVIADGGIYFVGGAKPGFHPQFTNLLGCRGMSIKIAYPKKAVHFSATLALNAFDATERGIVTVCVSNKTDAVRNKRYKWSIDEFVTGKQGVARDAEIIAARWNESHAKNLQITAKVVNNVVIASVPYVGIQFDATGTNYEDFSVTPGNLLMHCAVVRTVPGKEAVLYRDQVIKLLARDAADQGYEYPDQDWSALYPGYNNHELAEKYARIMLRTYTPKEFATVDEPLFANTSLFFPYKETTPAAPKTAVIDDEKDDKTKAQDVVRANEQLNPALQAVIGILNLVKKVY